MSENDQSNPRVALGLEAAANGDLHGLHKFLTFIDSEMRMLGLTEFHPSVAARLRSLGRDADRLVNFLDGFIEAGVKELR